MPNPTVYFSAEELAWIEEQTDNGGSRSGVIRDAVRHYREEIEGEGDA